MKAKSFQKHIDGLPDLFAQLVAKEPVEMTPAMMPDGPAIYVFWENGKAMRVGRARKLKQRIRAHHSKNHNSAAFAFKLTREATGKLKATYKTDGSRASLMADESFAQTFLEQSTRLKKMMISFVEVENPIDQYLLELYAAMQLGTSLSEFDTH